MQNIQGDSSALSGEGSTVSAVKPPRPVVGSSPEEVEAWLKNYMDTVEAARAEAIRVERLIAAAPELLAACKKAAGVLAGADMNKQALIDALVLCGAAISKAQGEAS